MRDVYKINIVFSYTKTNFFGKKLERELTDYHGIYYGIEEEIIEKVKKELKGKTEVYENYSMKSFPISKINIISTRVETSFIHLMDALIAEDFIQYCKDKFLPMESVLK